MNLRDEIRQLPAGNKEIRSFGITFGVMSLLLGGFLYWRHGNLITAWFVAALAFPTAGYLLPSVLRPVYKAWVVLALCLGWVMTRVILTILFYFVITPIAMGIKISGKRLLEHGFREAGSTYWIPKTKKISSRTDYEKQF